MIYDASRYENDFKGYEIPETITGEVLEACGFSYTPGIEHPFYSASIPLGEFDETGKSKKSDEQSDNYQDVTLYISVDEEDGMVRYSALNIGVFGEDIKPFKPFYRNHETEEDYSRDIINSYYDAMESLTEEGVFQRKFQTKEERQKALKALEQFN